MDEQQIIQMVNSGMPVENIAAMTGLTGDQIVKITSGVPANAVGMNLGMGSGMGSGLDSGMKQKMMH